MTIMRPARRSAIPAGPQGQAATKQIQDRAAHLSRSLPVPAVIGSHMYTPMCLLAVLMMLRAPARSDAFGISKLDCTSFKDDDAALGKRFGARYTCALVQARGLCTSTDTSKKALVEQYCKKTCSTDCAATKQPTAQPTAAGTAGFFLNSNHTWCPPLVCCCDTPWRGLHCGDFDECASRPCQNGGSCEDSSRTKYVNDYRRKSVLARRARPRHAFSCSAVKSEPQTCFLSCAPRAAARQRGMRKCPRER